MREALLYEQMDDQIVLCQLCPWECRIAPGESGRCLVRQNQEGELFTLNYGLVSAAAIEPIEQRGIYHLFPGSVIMSLGGWGDSLACRHRAAPTPIPEDEKKRRYLDPERLIEFSLERRARGIAWSYGEPGVWIEYMLDTAKLAKANGFFTLVKTNGMISKAALDQLGPYLNAYVVELLGAEAAPYAELCQSPPWERILEAAIYAKDRWHCHIEIQTPVIPGVNREDSIIRSLAGWIRDQLGAGTPWHLWRYEPAGELTGQAATLEEDLVWAQQVGKESGLNYIYLHKGEGATPSDTRCPACDRLLIRRDEKYLVKLVGVLDGKCTQCGESVPLSQTIFKQL